MDIGTAKPPPEVLARVPHRLIDICDPAEAYSAARFATTRWPRWPRSRGRGRMPLLVGGTMLYSARCSRAVAAAGRAIRPCAANSPSGPSELGAEAMHRWLAEVDPAAAARIHPNDPQRVQRALEVFLLRGGHDRALAAAARALAATGP
jgi:tRNA dimethylallyltransferase